MNIKKHISKKVVGIGLVAGLVLGAGGAAFAYFQATGSGSGDASTGNVANLTINQVSLTVNSGDGYFYPGNQATVHLTVTNGSGGNQLLGTVSLGSWTSSSPLTCGSSVPGQSGWFTMTSIPWGANVGPGTTDLGNTTIYFNESGTDQSACAGKTIQFNYTA